MIQAFRGLQDIGCLPHAPLNFYALNSRLFFCGRLVFYQDLFGWWLLLFKLLLFKFKFIFASM